jgi:hypothetical protein
VFLTLLRTGTITKDDYIGSGAYRLADGSIVQSDKFSIHELKVGNHLLTDVVASIGDVKSKPLLGQSFLKRFGSVEIDNTRHILVLGSAAPAPVAAPAPPPAIVQPSPAPAPTTGPIDRASNAFADGHADRQAYEAWFAGLAGEVKAGAAHWESARSFPQNPMVKCDVSRWGMDWATGCFAAMTRLAPTNDRWTHDANYKAGWDSIRRTGLADR